MFSAIEKFSQLAVFILHVSDYIYCEKEEGMNSNVSLHIYTLVIKKKNEVAFFMTFFFFNFVKFLQFYCSL